MLSDVLSVTSELSSVVDAATGGKCLLKLKLQMDSNKEL
jgi:hypothetical protein